MPNKKISQFPSLVNPTGNTIIPVVYSGANFSIPLSGLSAFVNIANNANVKYWNENKNVVLASDETLVISDNYVLSGTNLTLASGNLNISVGNINFNKYAQIFIGGYLLLIDSNIVNDGLISVAGAIIFSGNSTITGNGFLI
jgi:hypothetical protein